MILHKISRFFELDCYAFLVKVCILNQLQLRRSPYQKIKGLLIALECFIGLLNFSCFKFFIFQCFKPVTSCVVQEWDPPTTAIHLQSVSVSVYLGTTINKQQIMPQKTNHIRTAFILFPGHLKQPYGFLVRCPEIHQLLPYIFKRQP